MPDYKLGKIYMVYPKVEDADEGDVYYGSTVDTLGRRMAKHRSKTQCKTQCKFLFDKYGVENCFIELVEKYPCDTKDELTKKEGEYIRSYKCINKRIEGRTDKEYYDDNIDKILECKKQYYIKNIDKIKESKKQHYIENKDKYLEYQKQYRIENADIMKEYKKQYYDKNKDKISEQVKQKSTCPICNKEITKAYMKTHIKTQHK